MFKPEIIVDQFPGILTQAAKNTIIFTISGFGGGALFGIILALMKLSDVKFYRIIINCLTYCLSHINVNLIPIFFRGYPK